MSAFGIVHKAINPKNLVAMERAAVKPDVLARGESHRNLPARWARGRLQSREAGHALARRGGLQRTGIPMERLRWLNPELSIGNRGRIQAKAALSQVRPPAKRWVP